MTAFLISISIIPLIPVGAWFVRLFDFPRLQFAAVAAVVAVALLFLGKGTERWWLAGLCGAVVLWQTMHVAPYTPLWPVETPRSKGSPELTLCVANLCFENEQKTEVIEQLNELDSDLLLLIEVDQAWAEALAGLGDKYPHRAGSVAEEGLGLYLYSKLPMPGAEVKYLVSDDRPSIFAEIERPGGGTLRFVGVHPTPPGLQKDKESGRHDSRIRDAELMLVAKRVADRPDASWLVTGDFNDVAWSHTTRLFKRLSGLKDPRIGRGLYNTYHADYPLLVRFPIDHVFVSADAELTEMRRFRPAGSDHFGILSGLRFVKEEITEPEPQGNDQEDAEEMIEEGKQDAKEAPSTGGAVE